MRLALAILIGIHGLIHLFGFLKAFGWAQFEAISQPVPKPHGVIWLLAFVLFLVALILFLIRHDLWWIIGMAGVVVSQVLIIIYWKDAKFGTIANLLIPAAAIVAYSTVSFRNKVDDESRSMLSQMAPSEEMILTKEMIINLPTAVRSWLMKSGVVGKPMTYNVYLEQDLQMKLQPDQKDWTKAKAQQYFTVDPPAFNWSVKLKMKGVLDVAGRDKFENGKGEMLIKLFSAFPVVDAKGSEKIDQAALQRYLAEIVWFPSAAVSPYIKWEEIDHMSARATLDYMGTSGSGIFHFDKDGNFEKFVAMRYKDAAATEPSEWVVRSTQTQIVNGRSTPGEAEVAWGSGDDEWIWLKLKIDHIEYNVEKSI